MNFIDTRLCLIKVNISRRSDSKRLLPLLSIIPVSLNKDSEGTELGGADKYLFATSAKAGNILYYFSNVLVDP